MTDHQAKAAAFSSRLMHIEHEIMKSTIYQTLIAGKWRYVGSQWQPDGSLCIGFLQEGPGCLMGTNATFKIIHRYGQETST